jgi:uncharacterized protein (TIGR02147 family)
VKEIYAYYNYQKYLNDFYHEKKSKDSYFSFRYISKRVGIDHSLLVKIFQGKRHIGEKSIPAFAKLLGLSPRKTEYFGLLVLYAKAKTSREIKHYFERLLAFSEVHAHKVESDKYEFYQKWYYTAIREILHIHPMIGDDFKLLATLVEPSITSAEAKRAVRLLLRLGFIRENDQGGYELTSRFITTGDDWKSIAIHSFQKESLALAGRALEEVRKDVRDISTITMSLDDKGFERVRDRVRAFQEEIVGIAASCDRVNKVYQVNLQIFPLSKAIEHEAGGRPS